MILAMPLTMNNVSAEGNDEAKPSTSMETTLEELAKHFDYREAVNEATESNVSAYTIRLGMEGDDIWFPEHEWLFFRPSNAKATKLFLRAMSAKAPVKEMLALNIKDGCIKNIGVAFLTNDNKTAEDIFDRAVGNVSYRMPNVMPKDEPTHYERYIKDKNSTTTVSPSCVTRAQHQRAARFSTRRRTTRLSCTDIEINPIVKTVGFFVRKFYKIFSGKEEYWIFVSKY